MISYEEEYPSKAPEPARNAADGDPILDYLRPRMTGKIIVTLEDAAPVGPAIDAIAKTVDRAVTVTTLGDRAARGAHNGVREPVLFEDIGVAFISPPGGGAAMSSVMASLDLQPSVMETRPEFYLFALQEFSDTSECTWGVAATRAKDSPYTGKGIRIAILDTGIDERHPDFQGKRIITESFVEGETARDLQGHGTHCAGTAAARANTPGIMRYGVAPDADLYIGKVLNNSGFGTEEDILLGMEWAIEEGCEVVSMSLGSPVQPGVSFHTPYERVAQNGLQRGTLFLAAAGNDSRRVFGAIAPVSSPANTPSIVSIGAIDPFFKPANFSNGGVNSFGGELDLVAPGVGIFSSVPLPQLYRVMDGTSMACPHAAGIAALWAESNPELRGAKLRDVLIKNSRDLQQNKRDVGHGLVQAPLTRASV